MYSRRSTTLLLTIHSFFAILILSMRWAYGERESLIAKENRFYRGQHQIRLYRDRPDFPHKVITLDAPFAHQKYRRPCVS